MVYYLLLLDNIAFLLEIKIACGSSMLVKATYIQNLQLKNYTIGKYQ